MLLLWFWLLPLLVFICVPVIAVLPFRSAIKKRPGKKFSSLMGWVHTTWWPSIIIVELLNGEFYFYPTYILSMALWGVDYHCEPFCLKPLPFPWLTLVLPTVLFGTIWLYLRNKAEKPK